MLGEWAKGASHCPYEKLPQTLTPKPLRGELIYSIGQALTPPISCSLAI
jgi:hypothetical protein